MSKVKIVKVVPLEQNPNTKTLPYQILDKKYATAPTTLEENYAGFPVYLVFVAILPEANNDYQYLRLEMKAENNQFRTVVQKKQQIFKEIKRGNFKREALFEFVPTKKGTYSITFFVQGTEKPPEKKDTCVMTIKCEEPFEVKELIVSEDKTSSKQKASWISFPLFLQFSIESRIYGKQLECQIEFKSEKFKFKQLHNERRLKLKNQEIYYAMLQLQPQSIVKVISEKCVTLGSLQIKYGLKEEYAYEKKVALKPNHKYIIFKASTSIKQVPKKDIVEVEAIFYKIYNVNINMGNLKLVIDQNEMPSVKILKTSVDTINLDKNKQVSVKLTIICLKSGPLLLKGISLVNSEDVTIFFINQLLLNVGIEPQSKKSQMMENTSEVFIDNLL